VFGPLNQPGLTAADNAIMGTPPDPTGAIGPTAYVEFVNSVVAEYSRSDLSPVGSPVQLDAFVGDIGFNVFDVQIQWDPSAGRWFYVSDDCVDAACSQDSFLDVGWSKTADPAGMDPSHWCNYFLPSDLPDGTLFDDYPKLGHDDNHLLIGVNTFDGDAFQTARIYALPKPPVGDETTCPGPSTGGVFGSPDRPLVIANGNPAFTPVPANTADSAAAGYVVAADDPTGAVLGPKDQIMAWQVTGSGANPNLLPLGDMTVAPYDVPAPAAQPGVESTFNTLDTLDARLTQAVAHADPGASGREAVWTQHTIDGPGGESVARWYELLPSDLEVRQQGTIADPSGFVFNGAVSPAANGRDAAIQYNISSSSRLPEIRAQSQRSGTPLGQMSGETSALATSAAADQDLSCPTSSTGDPVTPCRWGDYAGVSPDPVNPDLVWGTNQISGAASGSLPLQDDPAWETQNFALTPEGPVNALPVAAFSVAPSAVVAPGSVGFDASASHDPDGAITEFKWDLDGNGTFETPTGTSPRVSHTYTTPGTVAVRLRVRDSRGDTSDAVQTVTVAPALLQKIAPPVLTLRFKKRQKLRGVLRRGVAIVARCNKACRLSVRLELPRKTAKRLHIAARYVTVGKRITVLAANHTTSLHIKLTRKARKRLRHVRKIALRLTAQATDLMGHGAKPLVRTVLLKR
jgi:PKD domain